MGRNTDEIKNAIQDFDRKGSFNYRALNRMTSTLQFLKQNSISIINKGQSADAPEKLVERMRIKFTQLEAKKIIFYTDGSTKPRPVRPNSGCSIVMTDTEHKMIFKWGMSIRTDGNNFLAELAAASCVIKALPMDVSATLRIDSKAAIGAISKGAISERRRVRAAGRTWLNYCRNELNLKRKNINIEHVAAHKGNTLPEQIGNAAADELANRVRLSGEKQQPCPYFRPQRRALYFEAERQPYPR